jgi:hypothetical protein
LEERDSNNLLKKRPKDFVKGNSLFILCNSCGALLLRGHYRCQKCNALFCIKCGKDFQVFLKTPLPYCPTCGIELLSESVPSTSKEIEKKNPPTIAIKIETNNSPVPTSELKVITSLNPAPVKSQKSTEQPKEVIFERHIPDEQKILNYIRSAKIRRFRNKEELLRKLSEILKNEPEDIETMWVNLERKYPVIIKQVTSKLQDEILKKQYEQANYDALHPKHKNTIDTFEISPESIESSKAKNLNLKDVKPLDGIEFEWKQGKMNPAEQKNYRSKLDE